MIPVLFEIGPFSLQTYGAVQAAGFLVAFLYLYRRRSRMGLEESQLWGLIYSVLAGILLGSKLAHALTKWSEGAAFWSSLVNLRYGHVYYGGVAGGVAAGWGYVRLQGLSFWRVIGSWGGAIPLFHTFGRLGCFAAGCCYGTPSSLPWAMRFTLPSSRVAPSLLGVPLHPAQLYEAFGELAIFVFIHYRYLREPSRGARAAPGPEGQAFLCYVLLYAFLRFLAEFVRGDPRGAFLAGLSPSQWTALATGLAAAALFRRLPGATVDR